MSDRPGGISGLAVALAAVGVFLAWSGIRNVPLLEGARSILAGRLPEAPKPVVTTARFQGQAPGGAGSGGTTIGGAGGLQLDPLALAQAGDLNARIVTEARKHLGKPYVWATAGPNTFDCSGLVSYVLQQCGVGNKRMVTGQFLVWSGAQTIPRAQMRPGDLVCWAGHIGIAVSDTDMLHAPNSRTVVKIGPIWKAPAPVVRRVKS